MRKKEKESRQKLADTLEQHGVNGVDFDKDAYHNVEMKQS